MIRVYLFVANRLTTVGNKDVKFGFKRIRSGTQVSRIINRTGSLFSIMYCFPLRIFLYTTTEKGATLSGA